MLEVLHQRAEQLLGRREDVHAPLQVQDVDDVDRIFVAPGGVHVVSDRVDLCDGDVVEEVLFGRELD